MVVTSTIGLEEQLTLRIEREFQNQLDEILQEMRELAKSFEIQKVKEKSPFKNVLSVATDTTSSLEALKIYIRYQIGRKESSKIWKLEKNEASQKQIFANAVVERIDNLGNKSQQIISNIKRELNEQIDKKQEKQECKILEIGNNSQLNRLKELKDYLQKTEKQLKQSVHLRLTQLYLGYLSREHTALLGYPSQNNLK